MKHITIIIAIASLAALLLMRTCKKQETITTTITTVKPVTQDDIAVPVPEPDEIADLDLLIEKGVQLDSLKAALRHVASRYNYYKRETISLREQLATLQTATTSTNCEEREQAWKEQAERLKGRNTDLDLLIDSLFDDLANARKVRSYQFKEADDYHERTTDVTVVGYIPPGGYQVTGLRYFIPTTTTTKQTTIRPRRNAIALMAGYHLATDSAPIYSLQYQRSNNRLGFAGQAGYVPQINAIQLQTGLIWQF